jgi:uncharacterized secreted protein with C-terminal beta-propeller domain
MPANAYLLIPKGAIMSEFQRQFSRHVGSRRGPRNLQVERLEDRWVMSGLSGAVEGLAAFVQARQTQPVAIGPIVPTGLREAAAAQMRTLIGPIAPPTVHAAEADTPAADFDHFQSLADLKNFFINRAVEQYKSQFGRVIDPFIRVDPGWAVTNRLALFSTSGDAATTLAMTSVAYSETNTQVAGVDEADLMETDGNYLYMLSGRDLVIVDVRSVDHPTIAARLTLSRPISSMYLAGDRLTLVSQENAYYWGWSNNDWGPAWTESTTVTVLDVADRSAPTIVQSTSFDGRLVDSRAIGDRVYLVFDGNTPRCPGPKVVHEDGSPIFATENPAGLSYRYQTEAEYRADLAAYLETAGIARYTARDGAGNVVAQGYITDPSRVYNSENVDTWYSATTVAVVDMKSNTPGPADSLSVPASTAHVYATGDSLYLLSSGWANGDGQWSDQTKIRKIALGGDRMAFVAQGTVRGQALDQFSVDESGGFLRIATTATWTADGNWTATPENLLFVLRQNGQALEVVGSLDNLAASEKIYSARFAGDHAFIVTYRQVDPLFSVDLSDPTRPQVKGELELPGFSNYLQEIEGGLLVGVGRNANGNGLYEDPQVSLFGVSDLGDPALLDRVTIPTGRVGGVAAFSDHHAIAYCPDSHILTVSVPDVGESGYGEVNDLYVFKVDTSGATPKLTLLGKVEHADSVRRSVEIGGRLISISYASIAVHDPAHPDQAIAELKINDPLSPPPILEPIFAPISIGRPIIRIDPTVFQPMIVATF